MAPNRVELDARGLVCPTPTLKMTNLMLTNHLQKGDTMVVLADCDTFEVDIRKWCATMKKTLIVLRPQEGKTMYAEVRF